MQPRVLSSPSRLYVCVCDAAVPSPFVHLSLVPGKEGCELRAARLRARVRWNTVGLGGFAGLSSPVGLCWVARFDYSGRYGDDVAFFLGSVFRLPFLVVVVVVGVCVFFLPPTCVRPPKYRPRLSCFSFEKDYLCGMPIHSSIDTPSLYEVLGMFVPTQPTPPTQHNTAITPNPALQVDPARGDRAR